MSCSFTLMLTLNWSIDILLEKLKVTPATKQWLLCHLRRKLRIFLFHREIIFCSRYSNFTIFNYPIIYQICDVMMGIYSAFFSVSSRKNLGTSISAGCLWWCCKYNTIITHYCVLSIFNLEITTKILSWSFLGSHSGWLLSFWVWMRPYFWMSFETQLIKSPNLRNW